MARRHLAVFASLLSPWLLIGSASHGFAEPPSGGPQGAAAEEEMTLVVGTRFIAPAAEGKSAKALFFDDRIPLAALNETDHCADQSALEAAQEYFSQLGARLGKAAHFYFLPDDAMQTAVSMCERMHAQPPKAWVNAKTKVIAIGQFVPTSAAQSLEQSIR